MTNNANYAKNANGKVAIDPISLEPVPIAFAITLNRIVYDARELATMISGGNTRVPWTRRTMSDAEIAKILSLAPDNRDKFAAAMAADNTTTINAMLRAGYTDVNRRQGTRQETALHAAIRRGNLDLVNRLLMAGANPNARNADGVAPLHLIFLHADPGIVRNAMRALLRAGAVPNVHIKSNGMTPLHFAVQQYAATDDISAVVLLVRSGAKLLKDRWGLSPLYDARQLPRDMRDVLMRVFSKNPLERFTYRFRR